MYVYKAYQQQFYRNQVNQYSPRIKMRQVCYVKYKQIFVNNLLFLFADLWHLSNAKLRFSSANDKNRKAYKFDNWALNNKNT